MKILYLEGFSPGPGLPYPLLFHPDNTIIHAYMPYSLKDIFCNPYVLLGVGLLFFVCSTILPLFCNYRYQSIKTSGYYGFLLLISIYALYYIKIFGLRWTIDTCVKSIQRDIATHHPDVIIGYSWGGGIASFMIERQLWNGHTILIAPAGYLIAERANLPTPNLKTYSSQQSKYLFIIQGTDDGVTSYEENFKLYKDALRDPIAEENQNSLIQFYTAKGHDHSLRGYVTHQFLQNLLSKIQLKL